MTLEEIEKEWERICRIPLDPKKYEQHELLLEKEQRLETIAFARKYVGKLIYMLKEKKKNDGIST